MPSQSSSLLRDKATDTKNNCEIEDAKGANEALAAPYVRTEDIESSSQLIAVCILAKLTKTIRACLDIAASLRDELIRMRQTSLAWRRSEDRKLVDRR